eukprot:COSAG02_NODE_7968_length_2767_cov_5.245127_2_plen_83_part_00
MASKFGPAGGSQCVELAEWAPVAVGRRQRTEARGAPPEQAAVGAPTAKVLRRPSCCTLLPQQAAARYRYSELLAAAAGGGCC